MLFNHIKLAWRNLLRKKLFAAINILGLAIGLCACLVIFLIARHELSFDKHHKDSDRIYRIYTEFSGVFTGKNRGVISGATNFLRERPTDIDMLVPFHEYYTGAVRVTSDEGEIRKFDADRKAAVVGPEFFELFNNYHWLSGSPESSLTKYSIVLTASQAGKYFGEGNNPDELIGKTVVYRDTVKLMVSGILADPKQNTDLCFTDFISFETAISVGSYPGFYDDWNSTNSSSQLFVKLHADRSPKDLEPELRLMSEEYIKRNERNTWNIAYKLQPLAALHFDTELGIFDGQRGAVNLLLLKVLGLLAMMILLVASVNFINLETARAGTRAREIGIRKVLGSSRSNLVAQFLAESIILSLLALTIALPMCQFAIVFFQEFIPVGVSLNLTDGGTLLFLGGAVLFTGVISGLYPAFVISGYAPVKALKAQIYTEKGRNYSAMMRKALTVFQFCFAQVLIACTIIVIWQTDYLSNRNLGFSSRGIITMNLPSRENDSKKQVLMSELQKINGVREVSLHLSPPSDGTYNSNYVKYNGSNGEVTHLVFRKHADVDYFSFYDMPIIEGRSFVPSDSVLEMVVNRTYVEQLGFNSPHEVLNEVVELNDHSYTIVGVINDFNFRSLHNPMEPLAVLYEGNGNCVGIKLGDLEGTARLESLLAEVESAWNSVYPNVDFRYSFLDEVIRQFYESEKRTAKLISTATIVSVIISCMGLFGLASFAALQRTKEIGIRKVLGASIQSIVLLLSTEFIRLVIVAFAIAVPAAYLLSQRWLEEFAYRVEPGLGIFAFTGFLTLLVALLTVSQQAFKAATENPVKALRNE